MKWAALIPLVGGQVVGSMQAIGHGPEVMMSYSDFAGNDQYIRKHLPDVPFELLDSLAMRDGFASKWGGKLDLITSTCPCAGLSTFSSAKTGSAIRESRNLWMKSSCTFVLGDLRPKVYLGENAPNLFTPMGRSVSDYMIKEAKRLGYGLTFYKTSSVHHGIPQRRPRTFYAFWEGGVAPVLRWFARQHEPARSYLAPAGLLPSEVFPGSLVEDSGYQFLSRRFGAEWRDGGGAETYDVIDTMAKSQLMREFVTTWDGAHDNTYRTVRRKMEKLDGNVFASVPTFARDQESFPSVIMKYLDKFVHPVEDRYLNYRETAWLMGLPLDFELPPIKQANIICQNVPTGAARDMTLDAMDFISGGLRRTDEQVLWYDNPAQRVYHGPERLTTRDEMCAHEEVFA